MTGAPPDPDPRVERSFALVRVVRNSLLVVFLGLAAVGVEAKGWPHAVTVGICLAALLLLARLAHDVRQLRGAGGQRTG